MLRTALTFRWIGWFVVLLAAVVAMVLLGLWQFGVAHDNGASKTVEDAQHLPVAPITEVVQPNEPFRADMSVRRVTATGTYEPQRQLLVPDRRLNGRTGYWVLTPLLVTDSNARLVVLRGFVTDPAQATKPTATAVTVTGALAPAESPTATSLPAGQIGSVDIASLVNLWGDRIYNAYVFATAEQPAATTSAITRIPPPSPVPASGLHFVNLAYAVQWWLFAVFAIYIYLRMLRDEVEGGHVARPPRRGVLELATEPQPNEDKEHHEADE
ncbi:SURF1 family protein [Calidifontibacter terrae]